LQDFLSLSADAPLRALVLIEDKWWQAFLNDAPAITHTSIQHQSIMRFTFNNKVFSSISHDFNVFRARNYRLASAAYEGYPQKDPAISALKPAARRARELEDAFVAFRKATGAVPPFQNGVPLSSTARRTSQMDEKFTAALKTMALLEPNFRHRHGILLWRISQLRVPDTEAAITGFLKAFFESTDPRRDPRCTVLMPTGALTNAAIAQIPTITELPASGLAGLAGSVSSKPHTSVVLTLQGYRPKNKTQVRARYNYSDILVGLQHLQQAFEFLWGPDSVPKHWCRCTGCKLHRRSAIVSTAKRFVTKQYAAAVSQEEATAGASPQPSRKNGRPASNGADDSSVSPKRQRVSDEAHGVCDHHASSVMP
jgi:hypothetical protein